MVYCSVAFGANRIDSEGLFFLQIRELKNIAAVINTFGLNGVHVLADGSIKGFVCGISEVLMLSVRIQSLEQVFENIHVQKGCLSDC